MLKTKLTKPGSTSKLIFRKELIHTLETGKEKRLALVSAPAGYGKSTLISQWVDQCEISCMWYSLDKSDNDIVIFLQYIIAGILSNYNNIEFKTEKILESNANPSYETLATFLINDLLEIKEHFYIIFDDYHLIENKEINNLISYLLSNLPHNIHLVLITRSDPSIPLARLRSQQLVTDIRLSDLSFNANNIYDFFKKSLNINLSIEDAKNLESKTEGWIAGLQLTGLSLQGKKDISRFINKLKGDNRYIMDYLIEEVLQQQTSELRDFLLDTSILKRFNASLCNSILGINNSQEIIEYLERNNMFVIPLDSKRLWYRYHHLLEHLLSNKLKNKNLEYTNGLHNKACSWYEKNGMIEDAIQHSIEIKDFKRSLGLLNQISADLWSMGRHSSLLDYGKLLTDNDIYTNPEFSIYYSWVLIHSGQALKADRYLSNAEIEIDKRLAKSSDSKELLELKGRLAVAQGILHTVTGNFEKIEKHSCVALEYLSEEDPLWYSWAWYTVGLKDMALNNLPEAIKSLKVAIDYSKKSGNIYLASTIVIRLVYTEQRMGHYVSAFQNCTELLDYIEEQGYSELTKVDWIYSGLYTTLSMINYMWGDFERAKEYIKIGYELSLKEPNLTYQFLSLFTLSYINYDKNDLRGCLKELKRLEELMHNNTVQPHFTILYLARKGSILLETEEPEKVLAFFNNNNITSDSEINSFNEYAFIPYIHYLISIGDIGEAQKKLDEINNLARKANRLDRLIQIQIIYSLIHVELGETEKAVQCLINAMDIASGERIVIFFLYYLDKIKELFPQAFKVLATLKHNIPIEYLEKLKILIERHERVIKNQNYSDISKRELETLKLIAENLTNQEIAEQLFISIQTVKSHVKSILLKLDIDSRHKAAQKAKELGLI